MKNLNVFIAFMLLIVLSFACEKENVEIEQNKVVEDEITFRSGERTRDGLNPETFQCNLTTTAGSCVSSGETITFTIGPFNNAFSAYWKIIPADAGTVVSGQGEQTATILINPGFSGATVKVRKFRGDLFLCETEHVLPACIGGGGGIEITPSCSVDIIGPEAGCANPLSSDLVVASSNLSNAQYTWEIVSGDMHAPSPTLNNNPLNINFGDDFNGGVVGVTVTDAIGGSSCSTTIEIAVCNEEESCPCPEPVIEAVLCGTNEEEGVMEYKMKLISGYEEDDEIEWGIDHGTVNWTSPDKTEAIITTNETYEQGITIGCKVKRDCNGNEIYRTALYQNTYGDCDTAELFFSTDECVINGSPNDVYDDAVFGN